MEADICIVGAGYTGLSAGISLAEAGFGKEAARPLGQMMFEGAQIIRDRVTRYGIDCDLKNGGVYGAATTRKVAQLQEHKDL